MPATKSKADLSEKTDAFRSFNRFYTNQIGVLNEHLLETPFSLTQARVIYELAHRGEGTASEIRSALGLDAGYLSRVVADFQKRGLLKKAPTKTDGRSAILTLTPNGRKAFEGLDRRSRRQSENIIEGLPPTEQDRLLAAMKTIE